MTSPNAPDAFSWNFWDPAASMADVPSGHRFPDPNRASLDDPSQAPKDPPAWNAGPMGHLGGSGTQAQGMSIDHTRYAQTGYPYVQAPNILGGRVPRSGVDLMNNMVGMQPNVGGRYEDNPFAASAFSQADRAANYDPFKNYTWNPNVGVWAKREDNPDSRMAMLESWNRMNEYGGGGMIPNLDLDAMSNALFFPENDAGYGWWEMENQMGDPSQIMQSIHGPVEGRQFGGPVQGQQPYMVGEQGPELFVPGQSGNIQPNPATPQASGGFQQPGFPQAPGGFPAGGPENVGAPESDDPFNMYDPLDAGGDPTGVSHDQFFTPPAFPGGGQNAMPSPPPGIHDDPGSMTTYWTQYLLSNPGQISTFGYQQGQGQANQGLNMARTGIAGGLAGAGLDPDSELGQALYQGAIGLNTATRTKLASDLASLQEQLFRNDIMQGINTYNQTWNIGADLGAAQMNLYPSMTLNPGGYPYNSMQSPWAGGLGMGSFGFGQGGNNGLGGTL